MIYIITLMLVVIAYQLEQIHNTLKGNKNV